MWIVAPILDDTVLGHCIGFLLLQLKKNYKVSGVST